MKHSQHTTSSTHKPPVTAESELSKGTLTKVKENSTYKTEKVSNLVSIVPNFNKVLLHVIWSTAKYIFINNVAPKVIQETLIHCQYLTKLFFNVESLKKFYIYR